MSQYGPYDEGKIFWQMVEFFIEPWEYKDTGGAGDFISWFCTNPEFSNSIASDLAISLNNPNFTTEQKLKVTKALLSII